MTKRQPTDAEMQQDLVSLSGYKSSSRCAICASRHPMTGLSVRGDIEDVYARMGLKNAMAFAKTMNVSVTARAFQRHAENHAPYIRAEAWTKKTRNFVKEAMAEHKEADFAIQSIINVGTKMLEEGELTISEKMYIEALKLKSREKRSIPLAGFIDGVEGEIFDGEIVETPAIAQPHERPEGNPKINE